MAASLIWVPNALDRIEHAVPDHDVVAAGAAGRSEVLSVCAASVQLCSLATPAAARCPVCESAFTRGAGPGTSRGRGARSRRWSW